MILSIDITVSKAPKLRALLKTLDPSESTAFFTSLADDFEILTSEHITRASATRHKTATRLGAKPSNYLARAATSVESRGSIGLISLTLQGDIFKRAFGDVEVKATDKLLTIPISAAAYNRRAKEFPGLFRIKSKKGNHLLVRSTGEGKDKGIEPLFELKQQVTLPQDRGLLPTEAQYLKAAEQAARLHVERELAKMGD